MGSGRAIFSTAMMTPPAVAPPTAAHRTASAAGTARHRNWPSRSFGDRRSAAGAWERLDCHSAPYGLHDWETYLSGHPANGRTCAQIRNLTWGWWPFSCCPAGSRPEEPTPDSPRTAGCGGANPGNSTVCAAAPLGGRSRAVFHPYPPDCHTGGPRGPPGQRSIPPPNKQL